jgi:hypothetical protein
MNHARAIMVIQAGERIRFQPSCPDYSTVGFHPIVKDDPEAYLRSEKEIPIANGKQAKHKI